MPKRSGKNIKRSSPRRLAVGVVGASGRMGKEITTLIDLDERFSGQAVPKDFSLPKGAVDVVVEFSSPDGLASTLEWCLKHEIPLVSGTTGLAQTLQKKLSRAARRIPILYSANMSLGVAVFASMLESARAISGWDFQISEIHHKQKKDRPSGTGLLLQNKLEATLGRELPEAQSIRGGGVPGIHQVWAMGSDEVLLVQHTAFNRRVFARGALAAALWLFDKKQPGLYDLSDLYRV